MLDRLFWMQLVVSRYELNQQLKEGRELGDYAEAGAFHSFFPPDTPIPFNQELD